MWNILNVKTHKILFYFIFMYKTLYITLKWVIYVKPQELMWLEDYINIIRKNEVGFFLTEAAKIGQMLKTGPINISTPPKLVSII